VNIFKASSKFMENSTRELGDSMLKQWRGAIVLCALAMMSVLVSACGANTGGATAAATPAPTTAASAVTCASGNLSTGGSTALAPLVIQDATTYAQQCSGAKVTTQQTGSGAGLQGVSAGTLQVGNSDVFASTSTYPGLVDHQVAVIPFVVMISNDVTNVTNLTSQQLLDIYTGKTTNWDQVGGPNLPIAVISRPAGSGTRATFGTYVLGGKAETVSGASHLTASTSGAVATDVANTKGAISYDTLNLALSKNLKYVSIDGVAATQANIDDNSYKFWNIEHMYTKGAATGLAKDFIDYVQGAASESNRSALHFIEISSLSASAKAAKQQAAS
jgi:phosphate transport system substrate-binding protein